MKALQILEIELLLLFANVGLGLSILGLVGFICMPCQINVYLSSVCTNNS